MNQFDFIAVFICCSLVQHLYLCHWLWDWDWDCSNLNDHLLFLLQVIYSLSEKSLLSYLYVNYGTCTCYCHVNYGTCACYCHVNYGTCECYCHMNYGTCTCDCHVNYGTIVHVIVTWTRVYVCVIVIVSAEGQLSENITLLILEKV